MIWSLQAFAEYAVSHVPGVLLWFDSTRHHNVFSYSELLHSAQVAYNKNPQSIGALHVNKDQLLRT